MRAILLLCLHLLLSQGFVAAQYENIWVFGSGAGLDFSSGNPVPVKTKIGSSEGCASVCDAGGKPLFYTEGSNVFDRIGNFMPNGLNLTGIISKEPITTSTSQGTVIVPFIDNPDKYYVFSLTAFEQADKQGRLYYSVVDMSLNGGLGDVEPDRKGVLIDDSLTEKMTAVTGDRCNIWLLVNTRSGAFKAFEITNTGLSRNPVISNVGTGPLIFGTMKVALNRRKIAITQCNVFGGGNRGIQLFDFDPYTGIVSNRVVLDENAGYYGLAFSEDNSKLYGHNPVSIFQFDLSVSDPSISKFALGKPSSYTDLKLAPDGKIYFRGEGRNMGCIEFPNLAGAACQFVDSAVELLEETSMNIGLPNSFPIFKRDTAAASLIQLNACFKNEITLQADTGNRAWDYTWDNMHSGNQFVADKSGNYIVHYFTPSCVYHTDIFKVAMQKLPEVGYRQGCKKADNSIIWVTPASGDTATLIYTWTNAAGQSLKTHTNSNGDTFFNAAPGSYKIRISSFSGCDTTLHLSVPIPVYQASFITDTAICEGDSIKFFNASTNDMVSWRWNFGDGDSSAGNSPSHIFASPGHYIVRLIAGTSYPCYDTIDRTIVVDSMPFVRFVMEKDSICEGLLIVFSPAYQAGADSLLWNFGDDGNLFSSWAPIHAYDTGGLIAITLTGKYPNCPDAIFRDTITVLPHPVVNLGPDQSICPYGDPVWLNAIAMPSVGSWLWSNGDTTNTTQAQHQGIYWLTVTSPYGCMTTDSIMISKDCDMNMPNAFTPNGDGLNDYFFPGGDLSKHLISFSMQIINRWGQVIFKTSKLDGRGWDGRFNNIDQPEGVYVYMIEAILSGGNVENYTGNTTLIR